MQPIYSSQNLTIKNIFTVYVAKIQHAQIQSFGLVSLNQLSISSLGLIKSPMTDVRAHKQAYFFSFAITDIMHACINPFCLRGKKWTKLSSRFSKTKLVHKQN